MAELHDNLKESELNTFIILYALKEYLIHFQTGKDLPRFADQLNKLIERYDKRATQILIKKNLISGVYNAK
jgi:hypothetical protein